MEKLNWGILSTGEMAGNMAAAFSFQSRARLHSVVSRSLERAAAFGARHRIERQFSDLNTFLSDPDLDVVYIASPQSEHFTEILSSLEAGKHVVCEKPLAINAMQARRCADEAKRRGLFLMEAMWMRFFPAMSELLEAFDTGLIGKPYMVGADFCINGPAAGHRLLNPALAGGALLDLGIYPISLTQWVLGEIRNAAGYAQIGESGVDVQDAFTVQCRDGGMGVLACGLTGYKPREAYITGTAGCIKIENIFFRPRAVTYRYGTPDAETVERPFLGNGYPHEIIHVCESIGNGLDESPVMPMADTINALETMDMLRLQWKLRFPQEDTEYGDKT
ncbi:MAG: Gfo/Idh/MocA family oxidoreductase [Spirochaetaceae bacterium]|nr:Gfo/Idh/MocA family oxidoreductase [Spirochaetaceae bacterium]MDT8299087.1 Gfo/Idh/MocA family oxidoreductase [Spirochaetaceae bacterium]